MTSASTTQPPTITVSVLTFAWLREALGSPTRITLPLGSTIAALRAALDSALAQAPSPLHATVARCLFALHDEYVGDDHVIDPAGGEVAVIPPVSGG